MSASHPLILTHPKPVKTPSGTSWYMRTSDGAPTYRIGNAYIPFTPDEELAEHPALLTPPVTKGDHL